VFYGKRNRKKSGKEHMTGGAGQLSMLGMETESNLGWFL
jgi:hypothetical protein